MSEPKTYVFEQGGNSDSNVISALAPLLQNKGVDPSVLAMMNNNGFGGNNFIWAIFLLALFGWGGNGLGFGNGGNSGAGFLANQLNNTEGRDLLMQAIQGNRDAVSTLSSTLNADFNLVNSALNSVQQSLCSIGKDIGMTGMQVINALQQGNMQIAQQIASGFSQSQLAMCQQTNALQTSICDAKGDIKNGLTMLGFQSERQTSSITETINAGVQRIVDGQTQAEIRELNALLTAKNTEISELRSEKSMHSIVDPLSVQIASIAAAVAQLQASQSAAAVKAAA